MKKKIQVFKADRAAEAFVEKADLSEDDLSGFQGSAAVVTAFGLTADHYGLNQLRYDLRKMKGPGLLERDGKRCAYRLSDKGSGIALTFILFTNSSAARSPKACFIIRPTQPHGQRANLKPLFTRPTIPFATLFTCWRLLQHVGIYSEEERSQWKRLAAVMGRVLAASGGGRS
jgi:hypothetical protein